MGDIQEFQYMVLNLENKERMEDKEMKRNKLTHKWFLENATILIVFMSEIVLSHLFSMVESCSSSLLMMHGKKMLLYMIDMMEKMLGFWDANSFFPLLMWGVLDL